MLRGCAVGAVQPRKPRSAAAWGTRSVLTASWLRDESTHAPTIRQPESVGNTRARTHPRLPTDSPTGRPNAPWLSMPSGVVGNNTTLLVVLAATIASLLVVIVVLVVRNRRSARVTDPEPGLRTLLYVDD